MTAKSSAAAEAAGRLWARAAAGATAPMEVATGADRMCTQLRSELGRWIGAGGYRALLERALTKAQKDYPVLDAISGLGGDATVAAAAVRANGAGGLSEGLIAMVAELVDLLGRIIGPEMAVQLVDQISFPSPRGVVSTRIQGGRDDD